MLFYIEYGCSKCKETMIVDAKHINDALTYAEMRAFELFDSYDNDDIVDWEEYSNKEQYCEALEEAAINDIFCRAEDYDECNVDHVDALKEDGVFEI